MKRFLPKFLLVFAALFTIVAVYRYAVDPDVTGELSAKRKIPVGHAYADHIHSRFPFDTSYIQCWHEGMKIDSGSVLVIGDSFSNREEPDQQGYQTENSWSRYTAESLGVRIINFRNYHWDFNPEHLFLSLVEGRVIPDHSIVIVESVERSLTTRLNAPMEKSCFQNYINWSRAEETSLYANRTPRRKDWVKETTVFVCYLLGRDCPTHKFRLSQPCFSHQRYGSTLFSYVGDERVIDDNISAGIPAMRKTLDTLFRVARQHNITLLYMIAADKYDAYEPLIVDRHKRNTLLGYFPSNDSIINTKELLLPHILSGTQDVYRLDDTHWSPVGSQIVGIEVSERIKNLR